MKKKIQSATHLMSHVGWWTTDLQARQNIQFKKRKKEKKTKQSDWAKKPESFTEEKMIKVLR